MSVFSLALSGALSAMLKIVVVFAIGIMAAHTGFLNSNFIPQLSNFSFMIIMPSLIIVNLAKQVTIDKLAEYWNILLWGTVNILSCYTIAFLYVRLFSPRKEYHSTIITAIAFPNTVSMSMTVFDSLCASPLFNYIAPTFSEVYAIATLLVFIYSIPWSLFFYVVGYPHLLELKANDAAQDDQKNSQTEKECDETIREIENSMNNINPSSSPLQSPKRSVHEDYASLDALDHIDAQYRTQISPNFQDMSPDALDELDIDEDPRFPTPPFLRAVSHFAHGVSLFNARASLVANKYFFSYIKPSIRFVLKMTLSSPPTMATFIGITLGLIAPLKQPFFANDGIFRFMTKSLEFISVITVPAGTLITAANIYHSINRNFGRDARIFERYQLTLERKQEEEKLDQNGVQSIEMKYLENNNTCQLTSCGSRLESHPRGSGLLPLSNQSLQHSRNIPSSTNSSAKHTPRMGPMDKSKLVQQSPYLTPAADSMAAAIEMDDFDLLSQTHTTLAPYQSNRSVSTITNEGMHYEVSDPPTLPTILQHGDENEDDDSTMVILPSSQTKEMTQQGLQGKNGIPADIPIEYDEKGHILPLPRLSWGDMLTISLIRLVLCPTITFGLMMLCDLFSLTFILPRDPLYRANIILASCSTSAEVVLMLVTKAYKVRQSFMLSLVYIVQYLVCLITIPMWLVIVISSTPMA